jgi:hydroxybutyrate-dimer hydrolase
VTASSGSRGIYGSIAVAGAWGLPKGCAVAYTDKGAGTDYFDLDAGLGVRPDGTLGARTDALAFVPATTATSGIAFKHAHSRDNPEADWGRHVRQAAQFALQSLDSAFPGAAPFTFANTRVIAVGISNGGGAVLRAAEGPDAGWLDAVVAGEPNITVAGARPLYDYATQAALLMPCALHDPALAPLLPLPLIAQSAPSWTMHCARMHSAGLVDGADTTAQARSAHAQLRASGWSDEALRSGAVTVAFDAWRAVAVTYASSYGRYGAGEHPCGYRFAALDATFSARPVTPIERAAWWADASGIPPGAGVGIVAPANASPEAALDSLRCLRALWTGEGEGGDADAARVRQGVAAILADVPRAKLPVLVGHGLEDGLIPPAFSRAPNVAGARTAGRDVRYWQVRHAQHFDAFLALPGHRDRYVALLPYVHHALDRLSAHLDGTAAMPDDAVIEPTPHTGALQRTDLKLPR